MHRNLKAVYERGVLRPLEPVAFKEHELLTLTVTNRDADLSDLIDTEILADLETDADDSVTLEEVREALSKIPGSMADVIHEERRDRI